MQIKEVCNVILAADIALSGYSNWIPIGTAEHPFRGKFDGNGHTIYNLTINTKDLIYAGLLGVISDGGVKNLTVSGSVTVTQTQGSSTVYSYVGMVVGHLEDGILYNCNAEGSINANGYSGDTLGDANWPTVGGIAGCNYAGTIRNCFTYNVTVDANSRCGNLVSDIRGDLNSSDRPGTVTNCYTDAASVAGAQTGNRVTGCEASVSAKRFASGEIGYKLNEGRTADQRWFQTCGTGRTAFYGRIVYQVKRCATRIFPGAMMNMSVISTASVPPVIRMSLRCWWAMCIRSAMQDSSTGSCSRSTTATTPSTAS